MGAFFSTAARRNKLREALRQWHGTPFVQGCALRGRGVDCVHFVREVLRACGVDVSPAETVPAYPLFWGRHQPESRLLAWLHESPEARERTRRLSAEDPPVPGDLWAVSSGRSAHHLGILGPESPPRFWHVAPGSPVDAVDTSLTRPRLRLRLIDNTPP